MKPRITIPSRGLRLVAGACLAASIPIPDAKATTFTWDGGDGSSPNWSVGANWVGDAAPAATGDNLVFAGTSNLNVLNDYVTTLGSTSFTFAAGAGSFTISSNNLITVGNGAGNDNFVTKVSTNDQTISANIKLAGGQRDRTIIMTGGGTLTLSGNIDFSNDWLFPTTSAGTIVLSGNNSGDGKGGVLTSGANTMRAALRNNVAGTTLALGSDTALGNSGSGEIAAGTANLRGMVANANMTLTTTGGNRNLAGSSLIVNTTNVTFNGANNLTLSHLVNQGGNRDFWVSGNGAITLQGGIALSNDQTGRQLYVNLTGSGGMVVNGKLYDTFNNNGLTSGTSNLRKAGTSTLTLNGDSSNYNGTIQVDAGTLRIGHANALGNTTGATTINSGSTLDLNGQTTGESINISGAGVGGNGALVNSNTGAGATLTADIVNPGSLTIGGNGDITATRIRSAGVFTITKTGNGTLTTNGGSHNNLSTWDIQAGKVVFANTSGFGADRGVTLNGGTLQLSGSNNNLVNDSEAFTINSGTFDLIGKAEAVASIGGNGGTITNSATGTTSTLYVGGGVSGTSSATFGGVIENGAGTMKLTKEGTGTQTLSGVSTYTGDTTVSAGTLLVSGALGATEVTVKSGATIGAGDASGLLGGSLFLESGADLDVSLGLLTVDNGATVSFGGFDFSNLIGFDVETASEGSHTLIAGSFTLDGANLAHYGASNAYLRGDGKLAYFEAGSLVVTITAVPEPRAALLGAIGILALLRRRRQ